MNRYLLPIALILISIITEAGNDVPRKKVHSFIKELQSKEWYVQQRNVWGEYLETNASDKEGWISYYRASRNLKAYGGEVNQEDLNAIVTKAKEAIPNSFEYHFLAYYNANDKETSESLEHIKKASELGPNRVEIMPDMLTYYEVRRDKQNLQNTAKKWFQLNDISSGILAWNYNMLQSTEQDAILITNGDNDTYPALILQYSQGIREDVNVLNFSLMSKNNYREKYFKELGIPQLPKKMEEYSSWEVYSSAFIEHIKKYSYRPIYFAISANPSLYSSFKDEVHNVGLAYKWSTSKFDNIAVTKRNFEKKFLLDYMKIDLQNDISQGVVDYSNSNYLVPLLTLYNHYKESEDAKSVELRELITRIAVRSNNGDKVTEMLKENSSQPSQVVTDPRILEEGMVQINDTMYASSIEVSNEMYELFLTDLLKQKRYVELNQAKALAVNWESLLSDKDKELSKELIYKNGHPNDPKAPVVNISYEAANLYCQWMTTTYNSQTHKKKKFGKVEFRLPTEKEWEYIASGGNSGNKYPWGGPFCRNAKGCFLANLQSSETDQKPKNAPLEHSCGNSTIDGAVFTVRGDSYFPNDFGLYCVTGNVAEMVQEEGISKGGSWNTTPDNATIKSKEIYSESNPKLGFRMIMIIK
jgi:hypothetical protein